MLKRGTRSKAWHGPQNYGVLAFLASLVLILLILMLLFYSSGKKPGSSFGLPKQEWTSFKPSTQFHPTVELRNGTDLIWQIPGSTKAVLFVAHGCNGRAANFWDRSPDCPKCIGLPEERLLVLHALARNFAVLTISSAGRCWTLGEERLVVKDIITWWLKKHKFEHLPLVALGASSGGYFVSALATNLRFSSIVLMIAEGIFNRIDITEDYPPTLFVHMPKDLYRQQKISEYIEVLRNKGVDVAEIKCNEFPLSASFLADRIPGLGETVSAKLFQLFRHKGFIDENGYMNNNIVMACCSIPGSVLSCKPSYFIKLSSAETGKKKPHNISQSQAKRRCLRCNTLYLDCDNSPTACSFHGHTTGEKGLFALAPPHQGIDGEWTDSSGVIVYKWNEKSNRPNTGSGNWKKRWSCCTEYDEDAPPCRRGWHVSYDDGFTLY